MSRSRFSVLTLALMVLSALPAPQPAVAKDPVWIKTSTPSFEIYTSAGEKRARNMLLHFERVRVFFEQAMGTTSKLEVPLRIVGFRNAKEYEPFRTKEFAQAYYARGYDRDYIVMSSLQPDYFRVAVHEYVHFLVQQGEKPLPIWMNEGLADYYSTLRPIGKKVRVGEPQLGRMQLLSAKTWLPLAELLAVDHDSPHYNEKNRAGVFYSQSWLLINMLMGSPDYRPKFDELSGDLLAGAPPGQAFQKVYGKSLELVHKELRAYFDGGLLYSLDIDLKLEKSALEPAVEQVSALEAGLVLGQVQALNRNKRNDARRRYEELAAEYPDDPRPHEAMGYMAYYDRDREAAATLFDRAVERGADNPRMYYDYAAMLYGGDHASRQIELLERATALRGDYEEAQRLLGFLFLDAREYNKALARLHRVKRVATRDEAMQLYRARAFGYYGLERFDDAKKAAEIALKYADEPADVLRLNQMIEASDIALTGEAQRATAPETAPFDTANLDVAADVDPKLSRSEGQRKLKAVFREPRKPPSYSGTLVEFECAETTALLHVVSGEERRAFRILDPKAIVVYGDGALEFTCGPQSPAHAIRVEFVQGSDEVTGIEFLTEPAAR